MTQTFTYLIGQPGAGKSTLVRAALAGHARETSRTILPHDYFPWLDLVTLGLTRRRFGGTDALHMGIMPDAKAFLEANRATHLFGEGDRLAASGFWKHAQDLGYDVRILFLDTPDDIAVKRRNERASRDPEQAQDPRWVRGRITKCANLAEAWQAVRLPGELRTSELAPLFLQALPFPIEAAA